MCVFTGFSLPFIPHANLDLGLHGREKLSVISGRKNQHAWNKNREELKKEHISAWRTDVCTCQIKCPFLFLGLLTLEIIEDSIVDDAPTLLRSENLLDFLWTNKKQNTRKWIHDLRVWLRWCHFPKICVHRRSFDAQKGSLQRVNVVLFSHWLIYEHWIHTGKHSIGSTS